MRTCKNSPLSVFVLLLAPLCGCQPAEEIGVVEGVVTIDGKPLSNATLFFRNRDRGIHIMANIHDDGRYQVFTAGGKGLPLGDYLVAVVPNGPATSSDPATGEVTVMATEQAGAVFPPRYQDVNTSGLSVAVNEGRNEFNVSMKSSE